MIALMYQRKYLIQLTLIFSFWLSGIFILGTIFTLPQMIESLTMWMFLALSLGSFFGGILADAWGRKKVFLVSSIVLSVSSILLQLNPFAGYIMAASAIGPMNNVTFVLIFETFKPQKKDLYTILVLIGWAFSQIFLGCYFYLNLSIQALYLVMFFCSISLTMSSYLFIRETLNENQRVTFQIKKIFPKDLPPLAFGCGIMFVTQIFYYRTQFTLDSFGFQIASNTIIVGLTEILANITLTQRLSILPRKKSIIFLFFILTLLFISLLLLQDKLLQAIIEGLMRFFQTGTMIILGVYIPQLFKMQQRGRATNFIMSFGVIGSAMSQAVLNKLPFWSLGILLIFAMILAIPLKQTLFQRNSRNEQLLEQL